MFGIGKWLKGRKNDDAELPHAPSSDPLLSEEATEALHVKLANLDVRRSILDWRDRHVEIAELHLRRELVTLFSDIDHKLDNMTMGDILRHQKEFGAREIEPIYQK